MHVTFVFSIRHACRCVHTCGTRDLQRKIHRICERELCAIISCITITCVCGISVEEYVEGNDIDILSTSYMYCIRLQHTMQLLENHPYMMCLT